jgi:hypothetical protein
VSAFGDNNSALELRYRADKGDGTAYYKHEFKKRITMVPRRDGVLLRGATVEYGPEGTAWLDNPPRRRGRRSVRRHNPYSSGAAFIHERKRSPRSFHRGSFRTVSSRSGTHRIVIGCPKSHTHRWVRGRCIGGMRVQSVLHPKNERTNPRGRGVIDLAAKRRKKGHRSRRRASAAQMAARAKFAARFGGKRRRGKRSGGKRRRSSTRSAWRRRPLGQRRYRASGSPHRVHRTNPRRRSGRRRRGYRSHYRRNFGGGFGRVLAQFGVGLIPGFIGLGLSRILVTKVEALKRQKPWVGSLLSIGSGLAVMGLTAIVPAARRRPLVLIGAAAPGVVFGVFDFLAGIVPGLEHEEVKAAKEGATETGVPKSDISGVGAPVHEGQRTVGEDGRVYVARRMDGMGFAEKLAAMGMDPYQAIAYPPAHAGQVAPGADGKLYIAKMVPDGMGFAEKLAMGMGTREPIIYEGVAGVSAQAASDIVMTGVGRYGQGPGAHFGIGTREPFIYQ